MRIFNRMEVRTCGAVFWFLSAFVHAQVIPIPNAGFEQNGGVNWPTEWTQLQHAGESAYRYTLDTAKPFAGKTSGKIEQIAPQVFGLFKQRIDVRAYAGKRISIRAHGRAEGIGPAGGGLYVRVDGPGDTILGNDFDSGIMHGTQPWKPLRAVVEIPLGAIAMEFGMLLQDKGAVWGDDFALEVTTDPITLKPTTSNKNELTFDSLYKDRVDEGERRRGKAIPKKP